MSVTSSVLIHGSFQKGDLHPLVLQPAVVKLAEKLQRNVILVGSSVFIKKTDSYLVGNGIVVL